MAVHVKTMVVGEVGTAMFPDGERGGPALMLVPLLILTLKYFSEVPEGLGKIILTLMVYPASTLPTRK